MKKQLFILSLLTLFSIMGHGQTWDRNGLNDGSGGDNTLGTVNNFSLDVYTNSTQRMKLNHNLNYTVNGYNEARNGYLLLGRDNNSIGGGGSIYTNKGAFSLLHLNGEGTGYQEFGYRPWMDAGVTFTGNRDLSYIGLRKLSTNPAQEDITETVLLWSDNASPSDGPDRLVFRFSGFGGSDGASVSSNRLSNTDLDALHVAQFTGTGLMGLGNTFGTNASGMTAANYNDPQSLMHMSYDWRSGSANEPYGFMQISYRRDGTTTPGTGETANDGLRIGIDNDLIDGGLNSYLRWQENTPFIIQTDWDNTAGGIANGERMRITSIGAPNVPDPAGAPNNNITRVAISHSGANPIEEPRSLLHLGYDVGELLGGVDGWRDWMDVGTFTNVGSDNMYVGLKLEQGGTFGDRYDAVVNWGDNQNAADPFNAGPDNLRFIFTSTTSIGSGDPVSTSNNGLEVARMEPGLASTLPTTNYGMMGVGNFAPGSPNDVNGTPVDAKLDIDGDLRIRQVNENDELTRVLVIDENDLNRVYWKEVDGGSGVGNFCSDLDDPLTGNYEIPLNDFNFYFTGSQPYPDITNNTNGVAVGLNCNDQLSGKLHVLQDEGNFLVSGAGLVSVSGYFDNIGSDALIGLGIVSTAQGVKEVQNTGGYFEATNGAKINRGVEGNAFGSTVGASTVNTGGRFGAAGGDINYGVYAQAGGDSLNGPDFAGYFDGDVTTTGGYYIVSDENLKENIEQIASASEILIQLRPVDYDMRYQEYSNMNLQQTHQLGLIAQEVEQVLPDIVGDIVHPAKYDSLGNEISPAMELKGVNYIQLIPLLIAGFQEQGARLAQQDSLNEKLNGQVQSLAEKLEAMEACLAEVNLCGTQKSATQETEPSFGQVVELKNRSAIILDQNLPNPFAEQTTITYTLPEEVMKAELVFYDMQGRIINQVQLTDRGQGKLTVYGENLRNGVYTYSLIADGKLIATKKMVKQ